VFMCVCMYVLFFACARMCVRVCVWCASVCHKRRLQLRHNSYYMQ